MGTCGGGQLEGRAEDTGAALPRFFPASAAHESEVVK